METTSRNISDLEPEEREAAEKLLGRPLVNFRKMAVRVLEDGNDIVIRFFGGKQAEVIDEAAGKWDVPACFNILTDLSDEERDKFDAIVSAPVKLSRPT